MSSVRPWTLLVLLLLSPAPACSSDGDGSCSAGLSAGSQQSELTCMLQPTLELQPTRVTIDPTAVGSVSTTTVTVRNTGDAIAAELSATVGLPELTVRELASTTLPPGARMEVFVDFRPTSPGVKTSALQVRFEDSEPIVVTIIANAVDR